MAKTKLKVGDKVYTSKGRHTLKNPGMLTVEETGRTWMHYDASICKRRDGSRKLYLNHNLSTTKPRIKKGRRG